MPKKKLIERDKTKKRKLWGTMQGERGILQQENN